MKKEACHIIKRENLADIHKEEKNVIYSHATVCIDGCDRFGEDFPKRTLMARVRDEAVTSKRHVPNCGVPNLYIE